jgi:hypothetical protein
MLTFMHDAVPVIQGSGSLNVICVTSNYHMLDISGFIVKYRYLKSLIEAYDVLL